MLDCAGYGRLLGRMGERSGHRDGATARLSRQHVRWLGLGSAIESIVLIGVLVTKAVVCSSSGLDCETTYRTASTSLAVTVCQAEYSRTHLPATGIILAEALHESGNRRAAALLAYNLHTTEVRSDAFQILAKIA